MLVLYIVQVTSICISRTTATFFYPQGHLTSASLHTVST